jgi:hypothetical protein
MVIFRTEKLQINNIAGRISTTEINVGKRLKVWKKTVSQRRKIYNFPVTHKEIYHDGFLLGYCAVYSGKGLAMFQRCLLPLSSGRST